jgi:hypothetical protein
MTATATRPKRTKIEERANQRKRAIPQKRAKLPKRATPAERATDDERTNQPKRGYSPGTLEAVEKLDKDLLHAIQGGGLVVGKEDVKYIIDLYYLAQRMRMSANNKIKAAARTAKKRGEEVWPTNLTEWFMKQAATLEQQILRVLNAWTDTDEVSAWAKGINGVGPIYAAMLAAEVDIARCQTVGVLWRYCGLCPTDRKVKGEKLHWNAQLKQVVYLLGQSFVRAQGRSLYREVYDQRKLYESEKNANKDYAEQAANELKRKRFGDDTAAKKWYQKGMLPPLHIHNRAARYAAKLFLSHYHEVAYRIHFGEEPPAPYAISILGHADLIRAKDAY